MSLLIWLGCADYAEQDFQTDYDRAFCEWQEDCTPYAAYDECLDGAEDEPWAVTDCVFDPEQAELCVEGVEAMDCSEDPSMDPDFPTECHHVWDCSLTPED